MFSESNKNTNGIKNGQPVSVWRQNTVRWRQLSTTQTRSINQLGLLSQVVSVRCFPGDGPSHRYHQMTVKDVRNSPPIHHEERPAEKDRWTRTSLSQVASVKLHQPTVAETSANNNHNIIMQESTVCFSLIVETLVSPLSAYHCLSTNDSRQSSHVFT